MLFEVPISLDRQTQTLRSVHRPRPMVAVLAASLSILSCYSRQELRMRQGESRTIELGFEETKTVQVFIPRGSTARVTSTQFECDVLFHYDGLALDHGEYGREFVYLKNEPAASTEWVPLKLSLHPDGPHASSKVRITVEWVRPMAPALDALFAAQKLEVEGRKLAEIRTAESLAEATKVLSRAVEIWQNTGDREAEAKCRIPYGIALERQGQFAEANRQYEVALRHLEGDKPAWTAARKVWEDIGGRLFETRATLSDLEHSLAKARGLGDRRWIAEVLGTIGSKLSGENGRMEEAIACLTEGADLHHQLGMTFDEVGDRLTTAGTLAAQKRFAESIATYESAKHTARAVKDPSIEIDILAAGAFIYGQMRDNAKLRPILERTAQLHASRADWSAYVSSTEDLAGAEANLGDFRAAWTHLLDAKSRAIEMKKNEQGQKGSAFSPTGNGIRVVVDHLRNLDSQSSFWFVDSGRGLFIAGDDRSRLAALQRALSPETLILEFVPPESKDDGLVTWAVTRDEIRVYRQPTGDRMVGAASRLYQDWSQPHRTPWSVSTEDLQVLSSDLFSMVRDFPKTRSLVVVQDGAFYRVPFAALPDPMRRPGTMGDYFEITTVPSAQAILASRDRRTARASQPSLDLAIIADPVVNRYDARLHRPDPLTASRASSGADWAALTRSAGVFKDGVGFSRLPHAKEEHDRLVEVSSMLRVDDVSGFRATKENVSAAIGRAKYVHFATHGVADFRFPGRSGLALSLWDTDEHSLDGFWTFDSIASTATSAELVTLGACQTGVGREGQGVQAQYGIPTLAHAFLHAGARRVVSTLWQVDDAASSALMVEFYRILFEGKERRPAVALWRAQQHIARQRQWADPYYWAGFVLVGDWDPL